MASSTKKSVSAASTDGASRASLKGGAGPARASMAKGGAGPADANAPRASLLKGGAVAPGADAPPEPTPGPTPEAREYPAFQPWNVLFQPWTAYHEPKWWPPREFWFDVDEEELEAARIAAEEEARLELKAAPIRDYLETTVVPLLLKGLQILAVERPENPVDYLAQYLIMKNPQPTMEEVVVEEVEMDGVPWRDLEAELLPPAAPTRAASVNPVVTDAQPPGPATRAVSVKPTTPETVPPAAATRAASVKPAAEAPAPAAARAGSMKPAAEAPATAAARAASVKPAVQEPPAVLGAAATRAASVKPAGA